MNDTNTHLTVAERDTLAEHLAASAAPMLTYAVAREDRALVAEILEGLDTIGLRTLCVILAAEHPAPLTRPDDGVIDEVAIERFVAGEVTPLSKPEKLIAAHRMRKAGCGPFEIGRRLMVSHETARRMLMRPLPSQEEAA